MKGLSMVVLGLLATTVTAQEFVNLNFDSPDLTGSLRPVFQDPGPAGSGYWGDIRQVLRGWQVSLDGVVQSEITYSPWPTDGRVLGANLVNYRPGRGIDLGGVNHLVIETRSERWPPAGPEVRLSQVGTIPPTATGIELFGSAYGRVLINGEDVGSTYDGHVHALDISRFAGQDVNLEFLFRPGAAGSFDIFGFTQVPEPSTWALFGCGAVIMGWMLGRRR
jgi:hypothetical protein